jgi:hypothetical protein
MFRVAAILALAVSLAACDVFSTLIDGWKHAKAVEAELELSTGMRPQVGFNWHNGRLVTVTVTFPKLYEAKSLRETAALVRRSVTDQFRQTPDDIHLAFSLGKGRAGTMAQLGGAN